MRDDRGRLVSVGWDECLDDLAARLDAVRSATGPDAVAVYTATGNVADTLGSRYAALFRRALGTRSAYSATTVDGPGKLLVAQLMAGRADAMPSLDLERATLTVIIGSNPVVSHGHFSTLPDPVTRLRALAREGRELWVVDPRRTETARLATRHLQPVPGSDWGFLGFAVRALLEEGGANHTYLAQRAAGIDRLRAAVAPMSLAVAQRHTGLSAGELTAFVDAVRRHGRVAAFTGTGTSMSRAANVTEWLAWALQIVMASHDRPGGMWFNPGFLTGHDRRPAPPPPPSTPGPSSRPDLPSILGEYPSAGLLDEIESRNVRALIVFGGNPCNALPQPGVLAEAASRLDVLAVADIVRTETTAVATHVLPCTDQLERADVSMFVDQLQPHVAAQYAGPVVPPGAERRHSWRIFADLGARLGLPLLPDACDAGTVTEDELLRPIVDRGRRSYTELKAARVIIDEDATFGWVERTLPEGRWQIAPPPLVAQLGQLLASDASPPLVLIPRRQPRHLNSALRDIPQPGGRVDSPDALIHPTDAEAAGIADGDLVTVTSAHGLTTVRAIVTEEIRQGAVSVAHGWANGACVGALVSGRIDCDPVTGMPLQSGVPVTLSPAR